MVNEKELKGLAHRVDLHVKNKELELQNKMLTELVNSEKVAKGKPITVECSVKPVVELSDGDFSMPLEVELDMIEEDEYKGVFLPAEELIAGIPTFFYQDENIEHNIIHIDHKNQFKANPSVSTRIGKLTNVFSADDKRGLIRGHGIITHEDYARDIFYGVTNKVSIRVVPSVLENTGRRNIGRGLVFQEVSLVVDDAYKKSNIRPRRT